MRFNFEAEQVRFQEAVRAFMEKEFTPESLRSLAATSSRRSPELWSALAGLGLLGILVPENSGGLGLSEVDLVLVLEESGRAALAEPLVETAAVAAPLLRDSGRRDLAERWLGALVEGGAVVTVGHEDNLYVRDAADADLLLLQNGSAVHALGPGEVSLEPQPAIDPMQKLFTVEWRPSPSTLVAEGAQAERLLVEAFDRGALATAAELVGAGQRMVDMAVAYACEREQFGRPIGSFQAVKHRLADAQVALEFARPVVYRAAFSVADGASDRELHVSHAKAAASEAASLAAKAALQVHGAIGYTWEMDLHFWMKRAWALDAVWGGGAWHRRRLARSLLGAAAA